MLISSKMSQTQLLDLPFDLNVRSVHRKCDLFSSSQNGKVERAKIRVEHIIREDYLVEAMEILEMYADLLLARFGLIQQVGLFNLPIIN